MDVENTQSTRSLRRFHRQNFLGARKIIGIPWKIIKKENGSPFKEISIQSIFD